MKPIYIKHIALSLFLSFLVSLQLSASGFSETGNDHLQALVISGNESLYSPRISSLPNFPLLRVGDDDPNENDESEVGLLDAPVAEIPFGLIVGVIMAYGIYCRARSRAKLDH